MSITAGTVATGAAIWRAVAPVKLIKRALNKRRARLGKPLLAITEEDYAMLPNGTMTHTGGGLAAFGPIIAVGLQMLGVGECTPEALDMGCIGAAQITGAIVTLGGAVLVVIGRVRAKRKAAAELAAAKAPQQQP